MKPEIMEGMDWAGQNPAGWSACEKFNGWFAEWTGETLVTKEGIEYRAPKWFVRGLPRLRMSFELFPGYGNLHWLNGITRWRNLARWDDLRLILFDVPSFPGNFTRRIQEAATATRFPYADSLAAGRLAIVRHWPIKGYGQLFKDLETVKSRGGEGLMIHHPETHYRAGRTHNLLKVKHGPEARFLAGINPPTCP